MAKMTDAQKRAALKYQKSLGQFAIRLPKQELERYKQAAEKAGMPFRAWVLAAMDAHADKMQTKPNCRQNADK
jgi:predicted DNA binding CopG/RHH family protein